MSLWLLSKVPMVKINSQFGFHKSGLCVVVKPPRKRLTLIGMASPKKMGAFCISVPHMRKHFTSAVRLWREKMKHSTILSDSPISCDTFFPLITSSFWLLEKLDVQGKDIDYLEATFLIPPTQFYVLVLGLSLWNT